MKLLTVLFGGNVNRKQYQKGKNKFDIFNKKLYRLCQSKLSKMSKEERQYWINKAKKMDKFYSANPHINNQFRGKYKPHIVMAEENKWIIHQNWAYIPSWCTYRKEHLSEEQVRNEMLKILKEAFKCQRESNTTNS